MLTTNAIENSSKNKKKFWINRICKIYPLYFIMTIVISIACIILPQYFRTSVVKIDNFFKSLLFIPSWGNHGKAFPIYSLGWTLNLEMFFYLVFFLSWKCSYKFRGGIASFICIILAITGKFVVNDSCNYAVVHAFTAKHIICFAIGIAIFYIHLFLNTRNIKIHNNILLAICYVIPFPLCFGVYLWGGRIIGYSL